MQVVSPKVIKNKRVLLRLDIDVPLRLRSGSPTSFEMADDFRLKAGLPTLKLCLEHAKEVIIMGHLGRPEGKEVAELSVAPILDWLEEQDLGCHLEDGKLKILENLRFEVGEEACDPKFAKELASLGEVFINEAFASYHTSASTTVLPTLLPHFAGLRFAKEVEVLTSVRDYKGDGLIAIIGGAKVEDKLPVIEAMAAKAEMVLVGGKLAGELSTENMDDGRWKMESGKIDKNIYHQSSTLKKPSSTFYHLPSNVIIGDLNKDGTDITPETSHVWKEILLHHAKLIVWNGPVGKIEGQVSSIKYKGEDLKTGEMGLARGTYELAKVILDSEVDIVVGGGDTVGFLGQMGLIEKFEDKGFVSTGGGAMLEFLTKGTLETIKVLD